MNLNVKKSFLFFFILSIIWMVELKIFHIVPYVDKASQLVIPYMLDTVLYTCFTFITKLGSKVILIPFILLVSIILIMQYRSFFPSFLLIGSVSVTHILNIIMKIIVQRPRPLIAENLDAIGYSFPSGHAMLSIVTYGLSIFLIVYNQKKKKILTFITIGIIFMIGMSRFILHVHYVTDIVAGFFYGWIIYKIMTMFFLKWVQNSEYKRTM